MAELVFTQASVLDAWAIALDLRDADLAELYAAHGPWVKVVSVLESAILVSTKCWVGLEDGAPIMLFGVAPVSLLGQYGSVGSPWMLGTPAIERHGKTLVKKGREFVDLMHKEFPYLTNYVDTRNDKSRRWLRRIGFVLYPATPYGVSGRPFHRFDRSAYHV